MQAIPIDFAFNGTLTNKNKSVTNNFMQVILIDFAFIKTLTNKNNKSV